MVSSTFLTISVALASAASLVPVDKGFGKIVAGINMYQGKRNGTRSKCFAGKVDQCDGILPATK